MCSRKWLTPATASVSSRAPVCTKKPSAAECASALHSAMISNPFSSVCLRNSKSRLQPVGPKSDDRKIARWILLQVGIDALAGEPIDQNAHFVQRPRSAQVVPVAGNRAAARGARFLLHDQAAFDAGFQPI